MYSDQGLVSGIQRVNDLGHKGPVYGLFVHFLSSFGTKSYTPDHWVQFLACLCIYFPVLEQCLENQTNVSSF